MVIEVHQHKGVSLVCDEPRYCNKNVATPKATDFNYQPEVRTNLGGIDTICAE